jgi:hypothetical protein
MAFIMDYGANLIYIDKTNHKYNIGVIIGW